MDAHRLLPHVLLVSSLAFWAAPVQAQQPSFDCAKAKTVYETEVCANNELAELDLKLSAAYATALKRLGDDQAARKALQAEQRELIKSDFAIRFLMDRQLAFLTTLDGKPRRSLEGKWTNPTGTVSMTKAENGKLEIGIETVSGTPPNFQICSWDGNSVPAGRDTVRSESEAGYVIVLERAGKVLKVSGIRPKSFPDGGERTHCTHGGTPEGTFFAATRSTDGDP